MTSVLNAITAAAAILKSASDFAARFVTRNTPESAVLAAIAAAYAGYTSGQINGTQAFVAVISALVVFIATESKKDAAAPFGSPNNPS